jgi:hypothetical protein
MDFNQDWSVCPPNVGGCLNIFTLILIYSQFWLNLPMDNHHCWCGSKGLVFYIMKSWSWNSNIQRYKRCLDTKLVYFLLCSALWVLHLQVSLIYLFACVLFVWLKSFNGVEHWYCHNMVASNTKCFLSKSEQHSKPSACVYGQIADCTRLQIPCIPLICTLDSILIYLQSSSLHICSLHCYPCVLFCTCSAILFATQSEEILIPRVTHTHQEPWLGWRHWYKVGKLILN